MADIAQVRADIAEGLRKFSGYVQAKDFDGLATLYTEDCRIYGLDRSVYRGKTECSKAFKSLFTAMQCATFDEVVEDVVYTGSDWAVSCDRLVMYDKDGNTIVPGKDLLLWKRVGGRWLIDQDTWNTNVKSPQDDVVALLKTWASAFGRGDYKKAASYFTVDCTYLHSNMPPARGREAVEETLQQICEDKDLCGTVVFNKDFEFVELGQGVASLRGTSGIPDKNGHVNWHCCYLVIVKKLDDGKWYIHHHLFTEMP